VIGGAYIEEIGLWYGDRKHFALWLGRGLVLAVIGIEKV
jgi:hypothetical protein